MNRERWRPDGAAHIEAPDACQLADPAVTEALAPEQRRRGRRLAIASHGVGQIHQVGLTGDLPALALVALGAGEALIGGQRFLLLAMVFVQLPTLRQVGRSSKRSILVAGQVAALVASVPLLAFSRISESGDAGVWMAIACFTLAGAGFAVNSTVWFPMLHAYVTPERTGRFFGLLRTGWHLTLIPFFLGARAWLEARPGDFGPVFGFAMLCGTVRLFLIARLPERAENTGIPLELRSAFGFAWRRPGWRPYFAGVVMNSASRAVFLTFAVVLMRRGLGFTEGDVLYTAAAIFGGGLASLYASGRLVDRFGPLPTFRVAALGQALAIAGFVAAAVLEAMTVPLAVAIFFFISTMASAFDVADTRVLFALAPEQAPARLLVPTTIIKAMFGGLLPLAAGFGLESLITHGLDRVSAYASLFFPLSVVIGAASLPLARFRHLEGTGN